MKRSIRWLRQVPFAVSTTTLILCEGRTFDGRDYPDLCRTGFPADDDAHAKDRVSEKTGNGRNIGRKVFEADPGRT